MHRVESSPRLRQASSQIALVMGLAVSTGLGGVLAQQSAPATAPAATGAQTPAGDGARGGRRGGQGRGQAAELAIIPGTPWRIHDMSRPRPPVLAPGPVVGAPPADAIVLFNGKDLSQWTGRGGGPAAWPVRNGYFETGAKAGSIATKDSFGDVQLHVEFQIPVEGAGTPSHGNSGVILMGLYEIQIIDSYQADHYPDGQGGSIYGEWPPLVNPAGKPGDWQTYDIVFEAPRFNGTALLAPAYFTLMWNGVLVHNRQPVAGPTRLLTLHQYTPHAAELPLQLQDHSSPVKFRNVWIRRLKGYDQQN
jgi:hypothetical protein